ncbi:Energy-dependent translational throttle protein EttA [Jeotgalibaca dankookensis]|uniref:Energy-dependent translational throttle protein EttA n=1 Tax=Jeotgalibaca dankookensis TaxID=708126 RepID=A0A1S6INJ0_9LACT|nr:ABC-F family ATP-binding cassette domain-containing protein [Jeotgalibaca dankookensis]AQS53086.1 Energy-dependent translational throttle protein EttA [Jeotgalibaca dankookensis]
MKDLKAVGLSKTYGMKKLFEDITFTIREGEYVGLIGQNGSGKSTLMKIIAGEDSADTGTIETSKDYRINYLPQDPILDESQTIFEALYSSETPLIQTIRRYEEAINNFANYSEDIRYQEAYAHAEQEMNRLDAWQTETQYKTILNKLGISDLNLKIGNLSGGQRKRIGLAKVLMQAPDLLLLDEPTNHLDVGAIVWLEKYLSQYRGALLLVTHDRYFLERVTNQMIELKNGAVETYSGNYASYLEQKAEREAIQQKMTEKQAKLYKSELAWMRKGAKARTTKQQARIHRFESLETEVKSATGEEQQLEINFDSSRLGRRVFQLEDVTLKAGDKTILEHFNHIFQAKDRIGIVGENGSGKTTILNLLAREKEAASGIVTVGETVKIGYYRQIMEPFPEDKRVITYLQEVAEEARIADGTIVSVTELLETFLFTRDMHGSLIRTLSGGERRRLYLLKLLMSQPNVLLFDEPTNDLDIETLTVLEDYLQSFPGAALVVSHDRYFLDKVAEKLLVVDGTEGPFLFYGSMSDYLEVADELSKEVTLKDNKAKEKPEIKSDKAKLTYSEQLEWDSIEEEIMLLEERVEELKASMLEHVSDFVKLGDLQKEVDEQEEILAKKWHRYEYLSTFTSET